MHTHWCPVKGCRERIACAGRACPEDVCCERHAAWERCTDCGNYVEHITQDGPGKLVCDACLRLLESYLEPGKPYLSSILCGVTVDTLSKAGDRVRALARATKEAQRRCKTVREPEPEGEESNATFKTWVIIPGKKTLRRLAVVRCRSDMEREMSGQIIDVLVEGIKEVGLPMMLAFLTGSAADMLIEEGKMSPAVATELDRLTTEQDRDTVCPTA